jgi:F-type H+-transporting ATPase subunit alpha
VLERSPVQTPLQTGVKVVDAVVPIGRGQRELIVGDRQTGKTQIAIDAIVHQRDADVICIYCAIGQRNSATAKVVEGLRGRGALDYTVVVVAGGEDPAGLRFVAPYAAMSIGEHFMEQGRDVLVVFDDLTHHARSYRELSLLLRRPPGREAYPGDIFYIHSRLLERSTHLSDERGGGSLTALPIIETEAQNISAYIPTNLISITDGQIYVSPTLFQQGQLPAVDVGRSVSRVGGKAQLKAFREAAGDLRLAYSQFQELEKFSRYGTRLQESQRKQLEHGRRVRYILRQDQYSPIPAGLQVVVLLATNWGYLDEVPLERIGQAEQAISEQVKDKASDVLDRIESGQELRDEDRDKLRGLFEDALSGLADGATQDQQEKSINGREQADDEAAEQTRTDSGAQDKQAEQDSRPDQEA